MWKSAHSRAARERKFSPFLSPLVAPVSVSECPSSSSSSSSPFASQRHTQQTFTCGHAQGGQMGSFIVGFGYKCQYLGPVGTSINSLPFKVSESLWLWWKSDLGWGKLFLRPGTPVETLGCKQMFMRRCMQEFVITPNPPTSEQKSLLQNLL